MADSQSVATPLPVPPPQGGRERWGARLRTLSLVIASGVVGIVAFASWWILSLGPAPRGEGLAYSTRVVDRAGRLLRPYTTPEGRWRLPATRAGVDPRFFDILFTYEDRRYAQHHGVDVLALGRALSQLVLEGLVRRQRHDLGDDVDIVRHARATGGGIGEPKSHRRATEERDAIGEVAQRDDRALEQIDAHA